MKKILMIGMIVVLLLTLAVVAYATPKALPAGTYISTTCNGDNTSTTTVTGAEVESWEKYYYFRDKDVLGPSNTITINLDEGRRLQLIHSGGYFAGLSREMAKKYYGASFLGPNTDIDDSDPRGAVIIVTCPVVKTK